MFGFGRRKEQREHEKREQAFRDRLAVKLKKWEANQDEIDPVQFSATERTPVDPYDDLHGGEGIDADPRWLPSLSSTGSYLIHETNNPDELTDEEKRAYERLTQSHTQWKIEQENDLTESDLTNRGTAYDTLLRFKR